MTARTTEHVGFRAEDYVPDELRSLDDPQTAIPRIAKDARLLGLVDQAVQALVYRALSPIATTRNGFNERGTQREASVSDV